MFNPGGYDLGFRPDSYWDLQGPISGILSNIKGSRRRALIRHVLTAEGASKERLAEAAASLDPSFYEESLSPTLINRISRKSDPSWMGGEFLPNALRGEIEIARITLDSVTRDVYSVR